MPKRQYSRQWHRKKRWIIASLLLFPPLGIPLLWLTRWPQRVKIGGSLFSGLILLLALTGKSTQPEKVSVATQPPAGGSNQSPISAPAPTPTPIPEVAPAAYDQAITSAISATSAISTAAQSSDWNSIALDWQAAINSLSDIPSDSGYYAQAQAKIEEYQRNYDYAVQQTVALTAEEEAAAEAQRYIQVETSGDPTIAPELIEYEGTYVAGSCTSLKERGVGSDFTPGDPNYTSSRDRDNDGVACES